MTGMYGVLLAPGGQTPGMLLDGLQYTGWALPQSDPAPNVKSAEAEGH